MEAAGDKLRKAIGKQVTDTELLATMKTAYEAGWRKVKLYFMVGFPGETDADLDAMVELTAQISRLRREIGEHPADVSAAVSWLVPKPHTPLGWMAQQQQEYFRQVRQQIIDAKKQLRGVNIRFKFHNLQRSLLEGALARGDRRLSRVLETAYRSGAHFDAWDECFKYELYQDAFAQCKLDPTFYAQRERGQNEILPWDHLAGNNKQKLYRRYQRIMKMLSA